jgi:SAM-dependent methyltransferase
VAVTTGADYCAVDIAEPGLAEVRRRAAALRLAGRARTALGSFEALPFGAGEAAAVMSIDALLFTPDKQAAAHELARVLRPGGRLVLTSWDYSRQLAGRPPQVADHRPVLEDAGFRVLAYEETPDWERRHRETDRLLLARIDELAAETGEHPDDVRAWVNQVRSDIPAVTHVDGSARLQTVSEEDSPDFHAVLTAFEDLTGCPVLVNTSFNVRGEPIVCTPEDAYACFARTEMDALVLEDCILVRDDQPAERLAPGAVEDFALD